MKTRKYLIKGRVQGVFFRKYTAAKAQELDLSGWVRNRLDGTVEVLAHGKAENLNQLQDWLWEGSPASQVTTVTKQDQPPLDLKDFRIERTI